MAGRSSLTVPQYVEAYLEAGTRAGTARLLHKDERNLRRWVVERKEEVDLEIARRRKSMPDIPQGETFVHDGLGEHFKIGILADTHLGSKAQQLTYLNDFYDYGVSRGVSEFYHAGDLLAGVDVFPGQTREIFLHDYDSQVEYAINNYPKRDGVTSHIISGNHDMVFAKRKGGDPVRAISVMRPDIEYCGAYSAWFKLSDMVTMYLLHPDGGSAYASSYRLQKTIESFEGGRKPTILVLGHFHRRCYVVERNVHGLLGAAFEAQTDFLRRKAIQPVIGGTILEICLNKKGEIHNILVDFRQYLVPIGGDY